MNDDNEQFPMHCNTNMTCTCIKHGSVHNTL